ncbi:MAG: hypothetical protein L0Z54_00335 [Thermoplasmata archaeon]|nr:hypothetical protein [Thermoplasmata archaeon]
MIAMPGDDSGAKRNATGKAAAKRQNAVNAGAVKSGKAPATPAKSKPDTDAVLTLRALATVLRHGLRFANASIPSDRWVECMGFLLGDVQGEVVQIKDAIPITNGSKVEVRFGDDHYRIADGINTKLKDELWVVGWYHTHPGHDLFLSTVDRVNHAGYQMLNENAVALVFDPSKLTGENSLNLADYMRFFRLKDPSKLGRSEYDELDSVRLEGSFSDMVDAIREITEAVQLGHPVLLEFEEVPAPSIQSLEELVNRMFTSIQEIRSDVKDLKVQQAGLEKQVRRTVTDLLDDEKLE